MIKMKLFYIALIMIWAIYAIIIADIYIHNEEEECIPCPYVNMHHQWDTIVDGNRVYCLHQEDYAHNYLSDGLYFEEPVGVKRNLGYNWGETYDDLGRSYDDRDSVIFKTIAPLESNNDGWRYCFSYYGSSDQKFKVTIRSGSGVALKIYVEGDNGHQIYKKTLRKKGSSYTAKLTRFDDMTFGIHNFSWQSTTIEFKVAKVHHFPWWGYLLIFIGCICLLVALSVGTFFWYRLWKSWNEARNERLSWEAERQRNFEERDNYENWVHNESSGRIDIVINIDVKRPNWWSYGQVDQSQESQEAHGVTMKQIEQMEQMEERKERKRMEMREYRKDIE